MMNPRPIWKSPFLLFWAVGLSLFLQINPLFAFTDPGPDCYVYPSPATAGQGNTVWVVYNMPISGMAEVRIYNESGDLVTYVREENKPAGPQQQTGLNLLYYQPGVYFCQVVLTMSDNSTRVLKIFKFVVKN